MNERTEHLAACLDHCIAARLSLAACASYLNEQGAQTATGGAFTLANLPTALEEIGVLTPLNKGKNDETND